MRIIITSHARVRIAERVGCRPHKVVKLVYKAWKYGTKPNDWFLEKREHNKHHEKGTIIYKVFMGGAFVFVKGLGEENKILLTTCLRYDHKLNGVLPHGYTPPLLDEETPLPKKRLIQATGE